MAKQKALTISRPVQIAELTEIVTNVSPMYVEVDVSTTQPSPGAWFIKSITAYDDNRQTLVGTSDQHESRFSLRSFRGQLRTYQTFEAMMKDVKRICGCNVAITLKVNI